MSESTEETKYYAVISEGRTRGNPSGLMRRRYTPPGPVDEALQRDLTWKRNTSLIAWEYGELGTDYVEISEGEAMALIERFRAKWAAEEAQR